MRQYYPGVSENQVPLNPMAGHHLPHQLVGRIPTPLKILVNGKDYPIYEMENKSHVPNHQPD